MEHDVEASRTSELAQLDATTKRAAAAACPNRPRALPVARPGPPARRPPRPIPASRPKWGAATRGRSEGTSILAAFTTVQRSLGPHEADGRGGTRPRIGRPIYRSARGDVWPNPRRPRGLAWRPSIYAAGAGGSPHRHPAIGCQLSLTCRPRGCWMARFRPPRAVGTAERGPGASAHRKHRVGCRGSSDTSPPLTWRGLTGSTDDLARRARCTADGGRSPLR